MMKCGSSGSLKVGAVCVNSGTVGVVAADEFDDEGGNDNDDAVDVLGVPVVDTVVGPVVVVAIVNAVVPVVVNGDDNDVEVVLNVVAVGDAVVLDGLLEVVVTC
jgi:hypothetical protein